MGELSLEYVGDETAEDTANDVVEDLSSWGDTIGGEVCESVLLDREWELVLFERAIPLASSILICSLVFCAHFKDGGWRLGYSHTRPLARQYSHDGRVQSH